LGDKNTTSLCSKNISTLSGRQTGIRGAAAVSPKYSQRKKQA